MNVVYWITQPPLRYPMRYVRFSRDFRRTSAASLMRVQSWCAWESWRLLLAGIIMAAAVTIWESRRMRNNIGGFEPVSCMLCRSFLTIEGLDIQGRWHVEWVGRVYQSALTRFFHFSMPPTLELAVTTGMSRSGSKVIYCCTPVLKLSIDAPTARLQGRSRGRCAAAVGSSSR